MTFISELPEDEARELWSRIRVNPYVCPRCMEPASYTMHKTSDEPYVWEFRCECPKCGLKWGFFAKTCIP